MKVRFSSTTASTTAAITITKYYYYYYHYCYCYYWHVANLMSYLLRSLCQINRVKLLFATTTLREISMLNI